MCTLIQKAEKEEKDMRHIENSNMAGITPTISIITLNTNELNIPIKSQGLLDCIFFF